MTGREIAFIDATAPGVPCVAGVHGLERRGVDGVVRRFADTASLKAARASLAEAAPPGVTLEDKGLALALHYRLAPAHEAATLALAKTVACRFGLVLQAGAMVAELRPRGPDKGEALRVFMAEPPFCGAMPIFVGDDLTDAAGFAAAEALGGYGVRVGDRPVPGARYALPDPAAVVAWLQRSFP